MECYSTRCCCQLPQFKDHSHNVQGTNAQGGSVLRCSEKSCIVCKGDNEGELKYVKGVLVMCDIQCAERTETMRPRCTRTQDLCFVLPPLTALRFF